MRPRLGAGTGTRTRPGGTRPGDAGHPGTRRVDAARRLGAALLVCAWVWGASLAAQAAPDSVLDARAREVASQLRCPVCQGESIQESPSSLAQEMRSIVRQQLAAGRSPSEVKAYFVSNYGDWILLKPRATGVNAAVYVLPLVMLLAGAAVIVVSVRRWTAGGAGPTPATESVPEGAQPTGAARTAR